MEAKRNFQEAGIKTLPDMPKCIEAEKAVIGALLLESTAINQVIDILSPEMFYDTNLSDIYKVILELYEENKPITLISVSQRIDSNLYAEIADMSSMVDSTAGIEEHALYVKQKYIQRKVLELSIRAEGMAIDDNLDIADTMEYIAQGIDNLITGVTEIDTMYIQNAAESSYMEYLERNTAYLQGKKSEITTGINLLDKYTGGLCKGKLIIVAARPAMGKTAFVLHIAKSAAEQGYHPVIFSLEMTASSLASRMMLSYADIDPDRFKAGCLSREEHKILYDAKEKVSSLQISINDSSDISMMKIKNKALQLKKKGLCDIILIDYLQLINMKADNKTYNREQEVSQVSRKAKNLSKELNVPVVLLSQLNRENEKRASKEPLLSDLRESGAIEQDADIVCFIHRPEYYDSPGTMIGGDNVIEGKGYIIIAKNRDGATGRVPFYYNKSLTRISGNELEIPF